MSDKVLKNLRVAVTGYKGFIGSWFVKTIRSLNISVLLLEGDVCSDDTWNEEFDVLYHFAAKMPYHFKDNSELAFSVNINGVLKGLESCRRNKAQMILPSTCGLYKPENVQTFSEEHPLEPPTAYTQSKLMGEILCRSYAQNYGVKSSVFRLFNVYGPGQDLNYIIPYLIKCGCEGETAEVYHPESSRDFVYVTDVVGVLLSVTKINELFSVYNVGTGKSHRISDVIEVIGQASGKSVPYKKLESSNDPQPNVCANIVKASNDLGWSANVNLKEGIQEIISAFQSVAQ